MTSHRFFLAAFAAGLLVLAWVAWGFIGTSPLALAMTFVIAAVFLAGAHELRQFRAATARLRGAVDGLAAAPASLPEWLEQLPLPLRTPVRARVEGAHATLPGPQLTPYLTGLLVMLGMLGTFLGMVITFQGAVFALQGSADLQAIRAALAEPIRGLGLSFGTSVAGVATSAMLGLMSTLARRERLEAARRLDGAIAGVLRPFSLAHHREDALRAMQDQARALPQVATALQDAMARIEQRSEKLDALLLERHAHLQGEVTAAYAGLAAKVGDALKETLERSARATGETVRPVVEQAMAGLAEETRRLQDRLLQATHAQMHALGEQFAGQTALVLEQSRAAVATRAEADERWLREQGARMDQLAQLWRTELGALRREEGERGAAAVERLSQLEGVVTQHLATLGTALEAPIANLLRTAAEVPEAAAGVIAQLREEIGRVAARDNVALQERVLLLERLGTLVGALEQATGEQRAAVEGMAGAATALMEKTHERFARELESQVARATDMAAHASAGAAELNAVAGGFGESVRQFQAGQEKLAATLVQVDASLQESAARSNEQLAYYVGQAREVIDLSIASQQGLIESLRQLQADRRKAVQAAGAAA